MAHSFSLISITSQALILLVLLHLSSFFNNLAAKHSISTSTSSAATRRHHHHRGHHNNNHPSSLDSGSGSDSNPRLRQAFIAFQAWKKVIHSDPNNFTTNWVGPSVCNYTGVYCAPSPHDPTIRVVAGIDLNHADIAGFLPEKLGLLSDLALIHLNSNRFCGILPLSLSNLSLLYELDLSNNRFVGPFPSVILCLPTLNYLDIRYNDFEGPIPPELFAKKHDAVFLNNNRFTQLNIPSSLPAGPTSATSVLVFANNNYNGPLPATIVNFASTLEELVLININLSGCLPQEVGFLYKLKVFDVSRNKIVGPIPYSMAGLYHLEQLNLAHNMMTGVVPAGVCMLPNLANFNVSFNFFCEEEGICLNLTSERSGKVTFDDRRNCLPEKRFQRSQRECSAALEHPVECFFGGGPPPSPPVVAAAAVAFAPSVAVVPAPAPVFAPTST